MFGMFDNGNTEVEEDDQYEKPTFEDGDVTGSKRD